ncbi:hypothetical protein C2845_PM10G13510 [Panicum miliaceum]|uniref:Uncharacterized protein n=1 Tax=Panicum miliaceum TaxID=4540 RepID=A0A3L6PEW0_PANMI|nr:hypothetical protein C2845_PM10G13510 [Panicum miliaceum]
MRVKMLVTSRMLGKKGASKGKAKECKPAATTGDGWRTNIEHPSRLMPSTRPLAIAASSEEEDGDETDSERTLTEVIKGKSRKTSQEGLEEPGNAAETPAPEPEKESDVATSSAVPVTTMLVK